MSKLIFDTSEPNRLLGSKMQLLEALDWTLMHESGSSVVQRENSVAMTEACTDGDLLISSKYII